MEPGSSDKSLIERYLAGKLSEQEEDQLEIRCLHDQEFLEEIQSAMKARLVGSFAEKYGDIGKQVFARRQSEGFRIRLRKISDTIGKIESKTATLIENFVNGLIMSSAFPVLARVRGKAPSKHGLAVELLESGEEIEFKRESDQTQLSIQFDPSTNLVILRVTNMPSGKAKKLVVYDSQTHDVMEEIAVNPETNNFEVPISLINQDVILEFSN
jgi:hypothetical protein